MSSTCCTLIRLSSSLGRTWDSSPQIYYVILDFHHWWKSLLAVNSRQFSLVNSNSIHWVSSYFGSQLCWRKTWHAYCLGRSFCPCLQHQLTCPQEQHTSQKHSFNLSPSSEEFDSLSCSNQCEITSLTILSVSHEYSGVWNFESLNQRGPRSFSCVTSFGCSLADLDAIP